MKIQMNPEGMGEVNLKVSVKGSDVNVQMVTETSEAKKLLEQGLNDLKMNLGSQKLNLETLKVDVANNNQDNAQFKQNSQDQQARQDARDFLNAFRENQQEFRKSFISVGGPKTYSEVKVPQKDPSDMKASRRISSERRLDLVA
jgi:flagellar hook-length control protein FliK